ncbi:MAG: peptidylprolyl isomerase [Rhodoferax sp.]|nr:peptidylprolyl isomerase [Rhodoferax sp.]
MFDFVRKHTKIMMGVMFLLIIPSFVMFGIQGYNRMNEGGEVVAKVAGQEIKQLEWDNAHRNEVQRVLAQSPNIDPKMLDSAEARYATLEKMVRDRVLAAAAEKSHLVTSDTRLARSLEADPAIASLRKADGSLDVERYRLLVGAQGMTPEMFEARVRSDLSSRQVVNGVIGTSFAAPAGADVALNAFLERREVQVAMFKAADFASKVKLTDAELEAWYKDNASQFQAPEQATIEYLVLDQESVKKSIVPNEQDLKTYYEQNASKLAGKEERRASHILIASPKSAPADDRQKARAKAAELLAAVRKAPASFADVAKKNSQDPGSATNGGDLDFFTRGAMVKPFEDAAFGMKVGDVSDVVESDFGYHIIKLTDIRSPKQRSFEEMRPELETELKNQQAARKFAETADTFTNGVYEQADSLKPIADRLKLTVQTAVVQRQPAPGAKGVLASAKFLDALFSKDAVEKKRNTEAVETAPSQLVSGRITQHTPARTQPFADVKEQVRQTLTATRTAELARKEGEARLAAWKANPATATGTAISAPVVLSRENTQQQSPKVVDAVLRADPTALPAWTGIDLGAQGYAVVKVNKVLPREAGKEEVLKQGREQYVQAWASAENEAYYNLLKERFKVKINVPQPSLKSAEAGAEGVKQ